MFIETYNQIENNESNLLKVLINKLQSKDIINTINTTPNILKVGQHFFIYNNRLYPSSIIVNKTLNGQCTVNDIMSQEILKSLGFYIVNIEDENTYINQDDNIKKTIKIIKKNNTIHNYAEQLLESKNIILRGAPGTGKSYLAKEIATYVINGSLVSQLTQKQKEQIQFVQFHPGYDYTDFVEGLRPITQDDGTMSFELKDGIFKKFVKKAKNALQQTPNSDIINSIIDDFFISLLENESENEFETLNKTPFSINKITDNRIYISYRPKGNETKSLSLEKQILQKLIVKTLELGRKFEKVKEITALSGNKNAFQSFSYYFILCNKIYQYIKDNNIYIQNNKNLINISNSPKYVFIIDEINRGEISKIFGELFFSIDPGYRGESGAIATQYSNLHEEFDDTFYIPENVYIIGTMNDIDRSVDSFDFAMRRRFRFIEIDANERIEMLDILDDRVKNIALQKMRSLNEAIVNTDGLNKNYQIGASYFLKLKDLNKNNKLEILWTDYLKPLLQEYIHGLHNEKEIMDRFEEAYNNPKIL